MKQGRLYGHWYLSQLFSRTILRTPIDFAETQAYARVAKGLRNPRRIRDAQLRIAFLTLSILLSYPLWLAYLTLHLRFVLLMEASIVLTTVVLYVLACDPLPPHAAKVRGWLTADLTVRQRLAAWRQSCTPRRP